MKQRDIKVPDVKVGDLIEAKTISEKGTEVTNKGVVGYIYGGSIYSEDDTLLVSKSIPSKSIRIIDLLSREEFPTINGAIIRATLTTGRSTTLVRVDRSSDDDELVWLELAGTGDSFCTEDEIDTWVRMKLVEG